LILLTATAIGFPALWLMGDQLNRQAWAQVAQGSRAVRALYTAQQNRLTDLAILTAQRPTLHQYITQPEPSLLPTYLQTLRQGANLDLVIICNLKGQIIAQVGQAFPPNMCLAAEATGFYVVPQATLPQVWLLAGAPIEIEEQSVGKVIVGVSLSNEFAAQIQAQTGLEHTLLANGYAVATSFAVAARPNSFATVPTTANEETQLITFDLNGQPYFGARLLMGELLPRRGPLTLGEPGLEAELALPVTDILATQANLARTLIAGILAVTVVGSVLGAVLARRISQPLARLTKAATRLSQGDLANPIPADPRVQEVAHVAYALEAARLDLQSTLNELQREKSWSNHLLESIVEGIVTLDAHQRITFFSQGAERITGWRRDEVVGRSCNQVFSPANSDRPFSELLPTLDRRTQIVVALPTGRQATLALTAASLSPDGQPVQTALVFRDVSEEEMMHRLVGHFLANIAHEFRTPLSALAASAELLLDQAPDLAPDELQELLNSLHLGVIGLQTLIDNLLESASIEAGRFRVSPRPSDLAEIINEIIQTLQPLLAKRSQPLDCELPNPLPPVQADPRRTGQVLINLLSNASKYSPDHSPISLGVTSAAPWIRVTVADHGPGIPPEYRTDLFRLFMRDRAGNDDQLARGGTGLGLSVVKAVVEAQGGQVGVDDRPGGGAIFWFTLPMVMTE
jgi:PAS domain S-box-containing protein